MSVRHPTQPIVRDKQRVERFKENKIVSFLLDTASRHGIGLNEIMGMPFSREDRIQFAQLTGYSVSGFGDLPYVSTAVWALANLEGRRHRRRHG